MYHFIKNLVHCSGDPRKDEWPFSDVGNANATPLLLDDSIMSKILIMVFLGRFFDFLKS